MAPAHRGTPYGIGCITIKQTGPSANTYVYAEWYTDGKHHCKSCGNSSKPESHQRARDQLSGVLQERIAVLEAELASLRKLQDRDAEAANPAVRAGPPPGRF